MPGFFITLEGIDRSGKGTQQQRVAAWLTAEGCTVVTGHEPNSDNPTGRYIQRILEHALPVPAPREFQRLYVLDRAQDTVCSILPALARGDVVVWDRYTHSSLAYGTGFAGWTLQLHKDMLGPSFRWPDVTFLLDISAKEALRRLARKKTTPEYFEKQETLHVVRQNYLALAKRHDAGTVVVVNGEQRPDDVFRDLQKVLQERMSR